MKSSIRYVTASIFLSTVIVSAARCQGLPNDDIVTLIYFPSDGSFIVDNPAGDDAAADAITTFELTSSEPFFTGPKPPEFNGLFDIWTPTKAFRLAPTGFFDMEWPAGSVATGVSNATEILTLSGSFLSGGALEPARLCVSTCVPEPCNSALVVLGALALITTFRRRNEFAVVTR